MKRSVLFWVLAVFITIGAAVFQRVTGPSYPVSGTTTISGRNIPYRFDRSHAGSTDAPVVLKTDDPSITGILHWKRFKTDDEWTSVPMTFDHGTLVANLPRQPVAGKLLYRVQLEQGGQRVSLPGPEPIVIRFRGDVPLIIFVPHLIAMFGAMLLSTRAGLEFFSSLPNPKKLTYWTLGFLFVGGFILGPSMQYYSFDVWWTGWPVGSDLTDNKTAVAFIAWVVAALAIGKGKHPHRWALGASIILLLVYLIPHSMLGSELDYREIDKQSNKVKSIQ
jgi:hypothetical protein